MNITGLAVGLGVILILGAGISPSLAQEPKKAEKGSADSITKEVGETAKTTAAHPRQEKEEYHKKIGAKLKEYGQELKEWKAKAGKMEKQAKAEIDRDIKAVGKEKEEASKKLKSLESKTGKAWQDLKSGMDKAMDDLGKSFEQIRSRFK